MDPTILLLAFVYSCCMLFFFIAFLVSWLNRRQQLRPYFSYGLLAGGTIVTLQLLTLLFGINTLPVPGSLGLFFIAGGILIDFFKMIIFTVVGMDYTAELQYPNFPVLSRMRSRLSAGKDSVKDQVQDKDRQKDPQKDQQKDLLPGKSAFLIHTGAVTAFTVAYSIVLFKLTNPEVGAPLRMLTGGESPSQAQILSPQAFLLVLVFAFAEEIVFRLGIQNFLAKHLNWQRDQYWLAIIATSALWTVGHAGSLSPDWVKFAQIFPVGLLLGWLFRKHGIESCLLAHGLFNVLLLPLTLHLVQQV